MLLVVGEYNCLQPLWMMNRQHHEVDCLQSYAVAANAQRDAVSLQPLSIASPCASISGHQHCRTGLTPSAGTLFHTCHPTGYLTLTPAGPGREEEDRDGLVDSQRRITPGLRLAMRHSDAADAPVAAAQGHAVDRQQVYAAGQGRCVWARPNGERGSGG